MMKWLVMPSLVLSVVVGVIAMWYLAVSDPTPGFSFGETAATVVGALVVVVAIRTLATWRGVAGTIADGVGEMTAAVRRMTEEDLSLISDALMAPAPARRKLAPLRLNQGGPAEVADLALSLQDLHAGLREVAWRQAEALQGGVPSLIVTLARRNAALIDRQLGLLDQLELGEKDPKVLGTYYTVDHLGTRVRRNVESLLVLAGEPPPRVWAKSLEVADVVRAAVSEIDEFQRVEIGSLDEAQLAGGAVADVAHLLAELLENATQFSPSTNPVKVSSGLDIDGYSVIIADRGPGMTNEEIARLNEVLVNPPPLGRVSSATTGLLVVSKLAARHGIAVELIPGIPGIVARVAIPRRLLEVGPGSPGSVAAFERVGRVVDLTDPALSGKAAASARPSTQMPPESPSSRPSVAQGESASEIRSALAAFDQGRRAATGVIQPDDAVEENDP